MISTTTISIAGLAIGAHWLLVSLSLLGMNRKYRPLSEFCFRVGIRSLVILCIIIAIKEAVL